MAAMNPHFVLVSESRASSPENAAQAASRESSTPRYWHFVLRSDDGQVAEDAWDEEADASDERLALLAVVRGLEAIPQPAHVTLVTQHAWIRRGLRFGLDVWRDNHWRWERYGVMAPIKHGDLWRRIDRALQFHDVQCCGPLGTASCDDLSSPAPRTASPPAPATKSEASVAPAARTQSAETYGPVASDGQASTKDLLGRLFGWCRLGQPESGLLMAAR